MPSFNEPHYISFRNRLHLYGYVQRQQQYYEYEDTVELKDCIVDFISDIPKKSYENLALSPPKTRKPIYETCEEILYPIYPISEIDTEATSKCSEEILRASAYYKEPVEPLILKDVDTSVYYKLEKPSLVEHPVDNDAMIALMSVQETQIEYAFEYDEDDDDVEDEQKKRQRLVQILCLGAIGLGIVTVSSIYVAFYLNQISR